MRTHAYILSVTVMKRKKLFCYRKMIQPATAVLGIVVCLRYAPECTEGIRKGILFCIEVLVPSLFLYMALAAYLIRSGLLRIAARPLRKLSRFLFRLPEEGLLVILLGLAGGYPVGAQCAAMMAEQGEMNRADAAKTAMIAVCAGPGFLLNYVGIALLNNRRAGYLLLFSQIVGLLLTGVIVGRVIPSGCPEERRRKDISLRGKNAAGGLIEAVADASRATLRMCGTVIVCAALTEVAAAVSPDQTLTDILSAFIEITTGCRMMCGVYPLYLVAFFIGFGGISVHLQIYAALGEFAVRKGLFFLFRIIQGIFTAAAAYILLMIVPIEQSVFSSTDAPLTAAKSATLIGSAALVLSAFCFLGSVRQKLNADR